MGALNSRRRNHFGDTSQCSGTALADVTETSLSSRPTVANYLTDASYEVVTQDFEDHTFYGIMFDIRAKATLPIEVVHVEEIWVRGNLGPMKVWWTPGGFHHVRKVPEAWTQVYSGVHDAGFEQLTPLQLHTPIPLQPGQLTGIYIHSPQSESLVYDNRRDYILHEDHFVRILPGMAHMDCRPFGDRTPWGRMGEGVAFRANRTFVGRLKMGAKFMLWNPETHCHFPRAFRDMVLTLLLCASRPECPLSLTNIEVLFWIINMCRWDWPDNPARGLPTDRDYMPRRLGNGTLNRWRNYSIQYEGEDWASVPSDESSESD